MILQDLLFPKFCLGCGLPGIYICRHCYLSLEKIDGNRCFYCGKASRFNLTHPSCQRNLYIDGVTSIFKYRGIMVKILKNIKYRLWKSIFTDLFLSISPSDLGETAFYRKLEGGIFLQPIPLSRGRLRFRGFNQALVLTSYLQKFVDVPIVECLERKIDNVPQAEVRSRKGRFDNVRGVFGINETGAQVIGSNSTFIVVDDVITTGSTMKEAARVLKRAGCGHVYAFSLARG